MLRKQRMDAEGPNVHETGKLFGISHPIVARVGNGEAVKIEALTKICNLLGFPVESMLGLKDEMNDLVEEVLRVISIEPELSEVFLEIGQNRGDGKLDKIILNEIAAFAHCRLDYMMKKNE